MTWWMWILIAAVILTIIVTKGKIIMVILEGIFEVIGEIFSH